MAFALIVDGKVHELWSEKPDLVDGLDVREVSDIVQVNWEVQDGNIVEPTPDQPDARRIAARLLEKAQPVVLFFFSMGEALPTEWADYLTDLRAIKNGSDAAADLPPTPELPEGI